MQDGKEVLTFRTDRIESRSLYFYYRPETHTYNNNCQISFFTNADRSAIESFRVNGDSYTCYEYASGLGIRERAQNESKAVDATGE